MQIQRSRFFKAIDASGGMVTKFLNSDCYKDVKNMSQLWSFCTAKCHGT
jgi:hypothetical protein